VRKEDIEPPGPGELPPRISFIEQMGGSAGYYVRFKDVPAGEKPIRKYIPILQFESQEKALQAAIEYRDRKAGELGLPAQTERSHPEDAKERMSRSHNRLGLRGLGLTLQNKRNQFYPVLTAQWTGKNGQEKVRRSMTSRGLHGTMEELVPHLQENLHPEKTEEELIRKGAEGAARLLLTIAAGEEPESSKRRRLQSLFQRWSGRHDRDREIIERVSGEKESIENPTEDGSPILPEDERR
jgi:type II secretory pathway component PulM